MSHPCQRQSGGKDSEIALDNSFALVRQGSEILNPTCETRTARVNYRGLSAQSGGRQENGGATARQQRELLISDEIGTRPFRRATVSGTCRIHTNRGEFYQLLH